MEFQANFMKILRIRKMSFDQNSGDINDFGESWSIRFNLDRLRGKAAPHLPMAWSSKPFIDAEDVKLSR